MSGSSLIYRASSDRRQMSVLGRVNRVAPAWLVRDDWRRSRRWQKKKTVCVCRGLGYDQSMCKLIGLENDYILYQKKKRNNHNSQEHHIPEWNCESTCTAVVEPRFHTLHWKYNTRMNLNTCLRGTNASRPNQSHMSSLISLPALRIELWFFFYYKKCGVFDASDTSIYLVQ